MKRLFLSAFLVCCSFFAFSQTLPSFQFGLKGGLNLAKFSTENTFSSDNKMGYFAGLWARVGAAGIHLQPELYYSEKNTTLKSNSGQVSDVKFSSLDVPILVGTKIGAAGVGFRLNTGPVASFIINEQQSFDEAAANIFDGDFKGQAFAWQFGAGLDIGKLNVDLRYELALSKLNSTGYPDTKLNSFKFGVALRLF
jgi:hypothetical protein